MDLTFIMGIVWSVGIFSIITGFLCGYIRGKINSQYKLDSYFKAGYKIAIEEFIGEVNIPDVVIEEALFEWSNQLKRKKLLPDKLIQ